MNRASRSIPQSIQGEFRKIKWTLLVITLGIYYFLPFVRWDRGPRADAGRADRPRRRRFYFFFIEIWPQEVYYLTGLLIIAALALFLMNAIAGRIWCGYLCPQTVWTDLFMRSSVSRGRPPRPYARTRSRWTPTDHRKSCSSTRSG
jgi:polyferredoxin